MTFFKKKCWAKRTEINRSNSWKTKHAGGVLWWLLPSVAKEQGEKYQVAEMLIASPALNLKL